MVRISKGAVGAALAAGILVAGATPATAAGSETGYKSCAGTPSKVVTRGWGTGTQDHFQNGVPKSFAYASNTARIWAPNYYTTANWKVYLSVSINGNDTYAYCPG